MPSRARHISPDFFPNLHADSYSSDRPTDPHVGGTRSPGAAETTAGLPSRPPTDIDVRRSAALQRRHAQENPRPVRLRGTQAADSTGQVVLDLGGPEQGFQWVIRRVNVGPLDYAAGSFPTPTAVLLTVTSQATSETPQDSAYEVVSMTTAYPAEGTWGRDELQLQGGDRAQIIVAGLTEGDLVTVGGQAYELATAVTETYTI